MFHTRRFASALALCLPLIFSASASVRADEVADFYKPRQMTLLIGTSAGNDYDFRGRLLARHMGKHIPGAPTIVPRNMPGGGGIVAANWMTNLASRDGLVVHMIMQNMMSAQAMGVGGVEFDTRKFIWLGNTTDTPNVTNAWFKSRVRTIEDARKFELVLGAPMGTAGVMYATLMNALAGTKFKIVTGYPGGNEVNLAMERGEVEGRGSNSWASWKSTKPEWLADKKVIPLVQVGLKRHADLPDVPLLLELATNDLDRDVLTFLSSDTALSRSLITTMDVPAPRVEALRRAFDAAMKDPALLAEAEKAKMDISPNTGEESQKVALSIVNARPEVIARAKAILGDLVR